MVHYRTTNVYQIFSVITPNLHPEVNDFCSPQVALAKQKEMQKLLPYAKAECLSSSANLIISQQKNVLICVDPGGWDTCQKFGLPQHVREEHNFPNLASSWCSEGSMSFGSYACMKATVVAFEQRQKKIPMACVN